MEFLYAFLYLLALICFLVGTFGAWPRVNLIALGLAFFVTPFLIQAFQAV